MCPIEPNHVQGGGRFFIIPSESEKPDPKTHTGTSKHRSPYVEWYYRLLTPGAHYLEYWTGRLNRDDVLRALAAARQAAAADPPGLQAAVAANRDIAARWAGGRQVPRAVAVMTVGARAASGGAWRACIA